MLAKCANPACNAPFLYLREGRLYQVEVRPDSPRGAPEPNHQPGPVAERRPLRRLEFFWLCGRCAREMTLVFDRGRGTITVSARSQRAMAS